MSNLQAMKTILHEKLKAADQSKLEEVNYKRNGKSRFHQSYPIVSGNLNYMVYRFPSEPEKMFPYFSEESGLRKLCDYLVLAEERNHLYLFLVELKLGKDSAMKQLKAGKVFVSYLLESAKRIGLEVNDAYTVRMLRISEINTGKRGLMEKPIEFIEGYYEYPHNAFRLKALIQT